MLENISHDVAVFQLITFRAGLKAFGGDTFSDFTLKAMCKFCSFLSATRAVNHFISYIGTELNPPGGGSFCTQFIVVENGGFISVAGGAIQSATCN
jgi:hypothetical protein